MEDLEHQIRYAAAPPDEEGRPDRGQRRTALVTSRWAASAAVIAAMTAGPAAGYVDVEPLDLGGPSVAGDAAADEDA